MVSLVSDYRIKNYIYPNPKDSEIKNNYKIFKEAISNIRIIEISKKDKHIILEFEELFKNACILEFDDDKCFQKIVNIAKIFTINEENKKKIKKEIEYAKDDNLKLNNNSYYFLLSYEKCIFEIPGLLLPLNLFFWKIIKVNKNIEYVTILATYKKFKDIKYTKKQIVPFLFSAGDLFIRIPVLYELIRQNKYKHIETTLLMMGNYCNKNYKNILTKLLGNIDIQFHNNFYLSKHPKNKNQYNFTEFEKVCFAYDFEKTPKEILLNFLRTVNIKTCKSDLKKDCDYLVCIQRVSSTRRNDKLVKIWDAEETKKFLDLCKYNKIKTINIEPTETITEYYDYDLGHFAFSDVAEILKSADAFIGIDSCFGHLCALLDVPNISLFLSTNNWYITNCINFMPINRNYTIIPQDADPQRIKSEKVFSVLNKILKGELILEKAITSHKDRKEFINYEIV